MGILVSISRPWKPTSARIPAKETLHKILVLTLVSPRPFPAPFHPTPELARQKVNKESKPISQSTQSLDAEAAKSLQCRPLFSVVFLLLVVSTVVPSSPITRAHMTTAAFCPFYISTCSGFATSFPVHTIRQSKPFLQEASHNDCLKTRCSCWHLPPPHLCKTVNTGCPTDSAFSQPHSPFPQKFRDGRRVVMVPEK